jgi:phosphoribosylamine--glycine ligase
VLEFNVRFGDPETQPILMRLQSDLPELCLAAVNGRLGEHAASWDPRACLGVVMAAEGYPGSYEKGRPISGLDSELPAHVKVFHAGTALTETGIVTSGGRVLCVCALGENVTEAQAEAYKACEAISWDGAFTRGDIGQKAVDREQGFA